MAVTATVKDLRDALLKRSEPAITRWNRLEGRPRTQDFDRALRAEVRDALWMLTRQWQMGEFKGDDAGSPVIARICTSTTQLDRFQAGATPHEPFTLDLPLETKVERRPLLWRAAGQKLSLDLRLTLGRRWRKMLQAAQAAGDLSADFRDSYQDQYPVAAPDPDAPADALVCAHPEAWRQFSAAAGRAMDGFALLEYLDEAPANQASDDIAGVTLADVAKLAALADELRAWLGQLIEQPPDGVNPAWLPQKLEYQFGCAAPLGAGADLTLRAEEYYQGHLDWYALERDSNEPGALSLDGSTFIPTSLIFSGMPNTRWWAFEDRRTNFGEVKPDTTDLGKLLLLEFGLVYANDWFVFPLTLPIGSITSVKGVAITNVFNERIWVEPVQDRPNAAWQRWEMYQLTRPPRTESTLVLLPAAPKILEAAPLEQVALVRDEMANMVWGVERRIPLPTGVGKAGNEAGLELFRQLQRIVGPPPAPPTPKAPIRYQVMNTVPENWIPFLPVHLDGSSREIRLQRAAMPRILGSDPANFERVRPRTALLREGLEAKPKSLRYYINEEEVPRAGAVVTQAYQRTRWLGGRTLVWLGASKSTGRGEGSSGLAFDLLVPADRL